MTNENDTQTVFLLIIGSALVIFVILLLIYWIREDKLKEKSTQQIQYVEKEDVNLYQNDIKISTQNQADFFQFNVWAKTLRNAQTIDEFRMLASQLAYELEERADRITLSVQERNQLLSLVEKQTTDL